MNITILKFQEVMMKVIEIRKGQFSGMFTLTENRRAI